MGQVLAIDILQDISFVLVEPFIHVATTTAVVAPGVATVGVPSTVGMYVGALLLIDRGLVAQEIVTVSSFVEGVSFTATFANAHSSGAIVYGATFPSGQLQGSPLFTLTEMLAYILDVENDFLLKTQPVYDTSTQVLSNPNRFYPLPASAIRLERISSATAGYVLYNESQSNLDFLSLGWESQGSSAGPTSWFQDQIGGSQYGIFPETTAGGTLNLFFSKRDSGTLLITSTLLVPDVFAHFIKYGVLARVFSKDGEQRDDMRAKYCQKRFDLGVLMTLHFMRGVEALMASQAGQQQKKFSGMPVPVGA
jgi:hypothetical protein